MTETTTSDVTAKELTLMETVNLISHNTNSIIFSSAAELEQAVITQTTCRENIDSLAARIRILDDEISMIETDGNDIDDRLSHLRKERGRANAKREHIVEALALARGKIERIKMEAMSVASISNTLILGRVAGEIQRGFRLIDISLYEGLSQIQHKLG